MVWQRLDRDPVALTDPQAPSNNIGQFIKLLLYIRQLML